MTRYGRVAFGAPAASEPLLASAPACGSRDHPCLWPRRGQARSPCQSVLGLLPALRIVKQLEQRAPSGEREQKPIERRQNEHPGVTPEVRAAAARSDQARSSRHSRSRSVAANTGAAVHGPDGLQRRCANRSNSKARP